jgi:hypothetical protein
MRSVRNLRLTMRSAFGEPRSKCDNADNPNAGVLGRPMNPTKRSELIQPATLHGDLD